MREEYEVRFKPIIVEAESRKEAEEKAVNEVCLGNLEVDEIDLY